MGKKNKKIKTEESPPLNPLPTRGEGKKGWGGKLIKTGLFVVLILSIVPIFAAQDQNPEELFRRGNRYYQNGEYENAVEMYKQIIDQDVESGALYFNLGNAYYKLNDSGKARLNYERARRFLQGDEALEENLLLLRERLVDQIERPPQFILSVWWNGFLALFSINMLCWISAGLLWLILIFAVLRIHFRRRGRRDRFQAIFVTLVVIFMLLSLVLVQKIYRLETEKHGIIMDLSATIYAEPSTVATEVFVLHEGTKVSIERQNDNWLEVKLADGRTGWIEQQKLEII